VAAMKAMSASKAVRCNPVTLPVSSGVPLAALNEITPTIESKARKKRITGVEDIVPPLVLLKFTFTVI
jgi:hypothetical protein